MVTVLCGLAYRKTEAPLKKLFKQTTGEYILISVITVTCKSQFNKICYCKFNECRLSKVFYQRNIYIFQRLTIPFQIVLIWIIIKIRFKYKTYFNSYI